MQGKVSGSMAGEGGFAGLTGQPRVLEPLQRQQGVVRRFKHERWDQMVRGALWEDPSGAMLQQHWVEKA